MQNFYNTNPIIVLNHRLRITWLSRNLYLIIVLVYKTFNKFLCNTTFTNNFDLLYRLNLIFFSRGFMTNFKTTKKKWKSFMTIAITKSLQHHLFKNGIDFVDYKVVKPLNPNLRFSTTQLFLNQNYLPLTLSNISLHNKPYRNVMFRYLLLVLTNWQHWNRNLRLTLRYLIGSNELQMLYFYNMYIFKIYNL